MLAGGEAGDGVVPRRVTSLDARSIQTTEHKIEQQEGLYHGNSPGSLLWDWGGWRRHGGVAMDDGDGSGATRRYRVGTGLHKLEKENLQLQEDHMEPSKKSRRTESKWR